MIEKRYSYMVNSYDYFDYSGRYTGNKFKTFTSLDEMWKAYKKDKTTQYNYGDSYKHVNKPFSYFVFVSDKQRVHAHTKYEWEQIKKNNEPKSLYMSEFSDEEKAYLKSLFDDIPDDIEEYPLDI